MKKIMFFVCLALSWYGMSAQNNIIQYEYWFDNNYPAKVERKITPTPTFQLQTQFPCGNLREGLHVFNTRFKDEAGIWSETISQYFFKNVNLVDNRLVSYEYWFDDDYSQRVKRQVSPSETFTLSSILDANNLSGGLHIFNVRFKDKVGNRSETIRQYFFKNTNLEGNKLVAYEYWINDDYDNKIFGKINNQQTFALLDSVNCFSANRALNTLSYRFKDKTGLWSSVLTKTFSHPVSLVLSLYYSKSVLQGDTLKHGDFYPENNEVLYELYNITKKKGIDAEITYPHIVLDTLVEVGDTIQIKTISRTNEFKTELDTIVLKNSAEQPVVINLIQYGYIKATYSNSENAANVGIVYNSTGDFVKKYSYYNQSLTTDRLIDGTYILVSMAQNEFYNTIQKLSSFTACGLIQDSNYAVQSINVNSGVISEVNLDKIPIFDENAMLYTGGSTSFTVNKTQIAIGNYVTLRSEIAFVEEYRKRVSDVKLIVDIPEECSFVKNSVMIGNTVFSEYTISGNQLSVPLSNYADAMKFCIIPIGSGTYSPNAFVEFTIDGETKIQPIGTADFTAEGLSIIAPSVTARDTIPVRGVSTAYSIIKIYDGGEFVGETVALANGSWSKLCPLYKPYAFSTHKLYAEINTPAGLTMQTETKEVTHNITAIEVSKVTMYNTAHPATSLELMEYVTEFNFLNPSARGSTYWYWPKYPDFTFKIEFTNNDSSLVQDVALNVLTSNGNVVTLPTQYDGAKKVWVANGSFPNTISLPINVDVDYNDLTQPMIDVNYISDIMNNFYQDTAKIATEPFNILVDKIVALNNKLDHIIFPDSTIVNYYLNEFNKYVNYFDSLEENETIDRTYSDSISKLLDNYANYISQFEININIGNHELSPNYIFDNDILDVNFDNFNEILNFNTDSIFNQIFNSNGVEILVDPSDSNICYYNAPSIGFYATQTISTCENIEESTLIESGYIKVSRTDNTYFYQKNDDGTYTTIDFATNKKTTIVYCFKSNTENSNKLKAFTQTSNSTNDSDLSHLKSLLEGAVEGVNRWIENKITKFNSIAECIMLDLVNLETSIKNAITNLELKQSKFNFAESQWIECTLSETMSEADKNAAKRAMISAGNELEDARNSLSKLKRIQAENIKKVGKAKEKLSKFKGFKTAMKLFDVVDIIVAIQNCYDKGTEIAGLQLAIEDIPKPCSLKIRLANDKISDLTWIMRVDVIGYTTASIATFTLIAGELIGAIPSFGLGIAAVVGTALAQNAADKWQANRLEERKQETQNWIDWFWQLKCPEAPISPTKDGTGTYVCHNATPVNDPSGYVYEAVPTNYLSGVTTSIYQKVYKENMYGEVEEKVVQWDASEYAQENPLVTNEYGIYGWDVPEGEWQVKYEKLGYRTEYSDWLSVPPPQLNINQGMVQVAEPAVNEVNGYENRIDINFSRYMLPATISANTVSITRNGVPETGIIKTLNEEANPQNPQQTFVSKICFIPSSPFNINDVVMLAVSKDVKSYAGTNMADDYLQRVYIQRKVEGIVTDSVVSVLLNQNIPLTVFVTPFDVATNKKILARSVSSSIATVTSGVALNNKGQATLQVKGELPGRTVIYISVDSTNLKAQVEVNVKMPVLVSGILLNKDSISLCVGKTDTLVTIISPINASNQGVVWTSNDTTIVRVTGGILTAVSPGNAVITVTSVDGNKMANCKVFVTETSETQNVIAIGSEITLSPNPAKDFVIIKGAEDKTIIVYDNLGKLILKRKIMFDTENISLSSWQMGVYFVKIINNGNEIGTVKLIKN